MTWRLLLRCAFGALAALTFIAAPISLICAAWLGANEVLSVEGTVKELLQRDAFDIDQLNAVLASRGSTMVLRGGVDAIDNPNDEWTQLAEVLFYPKERWSSGHLTILLFGLALCNATGTVIVLLTLGRPGTDFSAAQ